MGCNPSKLDVVPESESDPNAKLVSFIVWGAQFTGSTGDVLDKGDPYCIVRIGPKGSGWASKPRGGGRRSRPMKDTNAPQWRLGFTADLRGLQEPEVQVRVYDKDFCTEDDFLGEATLPFAALSDVTSKDQALMREGKGTGSISLGSGPAGFLTQHNIQPSSFYEALAPMGAVKSVKIQDITAEGPFHIGGEKLPEALRGLFWLSEQKESSALASFGGPSNDGGGCCPGRLSGGTLSLRVGGDRVWSMADNNAFSWKFVEAADLVYNFVFNDNDKPTCCQIYPEARNLGLTLTAEWLLDFEMILEQDGKHAYPGSFVWKRLSSALGKSGMEYALIQVMDANGKRLEPAWTEFTKYMESKKTGSYPDMIFYREIP